MSGLEGRRRGQRHPATGKTQKKKIFSDWMVGCRGIVVHELAGNDQSKKLAWSGSNRCQQSKWHCRCRMDVVTCHLVLFTCATSAFQRRKQSYKQQFFIIILLWLNWVHIHIDGCVLWKSKHGASIFMYIYYVYYEFLYNTLILKFLSLHLFSQGRRLSQNEKYAIYLIHPRKERVQFIQSTRGGYINK